MVFGSPRQCDPFPMQSLDSMSKGRAIPFLEDIGADFDDIIRPDTDEEAIKGPMVQVA